MHVRSWCESYHAPFAPAITPEVIELSRARAVYSAGDFVIAQIVAFERSVGKSLCPFRFTPGSARSGAACAELR
jgi:hypothetical protein